MGNTMTMKNAKLLANYTRKIGELCEQACALAKSARENIAPQEDADKVSAEIYAVNDKLTHASLLCKEYFVDPLFGALKRNGDDEIENTLVLEMEKAFDSAVRSAFPNTETFEYTTLGDLGVYRIDSGSVLVANLDTLKGTLTVEACDYDFVGEVHRLVDDYDLDEGDLARLLDDTLGRKHFAKKRIENLETHGIMESILEEKFVGIWSWDDLTDAINSKRFAAMFKKLARINARRTKEAIAIAGMLQRDSDCWGLYEFRSPEKAKKKLISHIAGRGDKKNKNFRSGDVIRANGMEQIVLGDHIDEAEIRTQVETVPVESIEGHWTGHALNAIITVGYDHLGNRKASEFANSRLRLDYLHILEITAGKIANGELSCTNAWQNKPESSKQS